MQKNGYVRAIAVTTSATMILGASTQRCTLLFSTPVGTTTYTVSTDPAVALNGGLNLQASGGPILLTEELFGDALKKPWYGIASAGVTIGVLETVSGG